MDKDIDIPLTSVSAIAVVDLANELSRRGCVDISILREQNEEFDRVYEAWRNDQLIQEQRLPESLLTTLWRAAEQHYGDSEIGLEIGNKVNLDARGLLANWLSQCSTLEEAFSVFSNNIHLLNPMEQWEKETLGDQTLLRQTFKNNDYPAIAIDRSMAAAVAWSAKLSDTEFTPISAQFTRAKPANDSLYKQIFGPNLTFGQNENSIAFPTKLFHSPIRHASPYLRALLAEQASSLDKMQVSSGLSEQVNRYLEMDLARYSHIDILSKELDLSRSTLFRQLKQENTTYTELLRSARLEKVKSLEEMSHTPSAIAEALGFKDISSYYRFIKNAR